jgi:hypothetical protein
MKKAAFELWKAKLPLASIRKHPRENPAQSAHASLTYGRIKMADSAYLKKLVESMLRRLLEVIERGDGVSKC